MRTIEVDAFSPGCFGMLVARSQVEIGTGPDWQLYAINGFS